MKKILAVASATLMLSSIAGVSVAHHRNDHTANTHGMCTAYFSGSENGQQKKQENGNAFNVWEATLQAAENEGDFDGDGDFDRYDVAAYCTDATGGYGNPGGGNTPYFGEEDTPNEDCTDCYGDGNGTGSNGGRGNGNNGG